MCPEGGGGGVLEEFGWGTGVGGNYEEETFSELFRQYLLQMSRMPFHGVKGLI